MLFQSPDFLLYFLPIVVVLFLFLKQFQNKKLANFMLVAASLFFYGYWKPIYLPLIIASVIFNFYYGLFLYRKGTQRHLVLGVLANLSILFFFKYLNFVTQSVADIIDFSIEPFAWALPLGISFFTFQNIMYLVDAFEKETEESNLANYFLFVTFFPQLIAGPIVQHSEMMPQFQKAKKYSWDLFWIGVMIFCIGLIKKIGLADTFAVWVHNGYNSVEKLQVFEAWATSLSYCFQLYFDFSGYSDMAIGLGLVFNIRLPENFNSPYKATSLIDFWKRWHMTLTRFVNVFIYLPIMRKFSDLTFSRVMLATLVTMTMVGVWHGANWTFVVFGIAHGLGLVVNHLSKKMGLKIPSLLGWFLMFLFINFTFVIFRASNLQSAAQMIEAMLGKNGMVLDPVIFSRFTFLAEWNITFGSWFIHLGLLDRKFLVMALMSLFIVLFCKNTAEMMEGFKFRWRDMMLLSTAVVLAFNVVMSASNPADFLYFNF